MGQIHHVEPVALTLVDHRDLIGEMQEVSTEEGGRYNSHSEGVFRRFYIDALLDA